MAPNPLIRFVNKGSKPLTIYFMQADFQPDSVNIPNLSAYSTVIGSPMKLDAGDEKDWRPILLNSPPSSIPKEKLKTIPVSGKLRLLAVTTSGKYEKQTKLTFAYTTVAP